MSLRSVLSAAAAAAAAAYLFDPVAGRRRQSVLKDKGTGVSLSAEDGQYAIGVARACGAVTVDVGAVHDVGSSYLQAS